MRGCKRDGAGQAQHRVPQVPVCRRDAQCGDDGAVRIDNRRRRTGETGRGRKVVRCSIDRDAAASVGTDRSGWAATAVPLIQPRVVGTGAELTSVEPWVDAAFICSACSVIEDQVEARPEDDPAKSAEVLLSFDDQLLNCALGMQG